MASCNHLCGQYPKNTSIEGDLLEVDPDIMGIGVNICTSLCKRHRTHHLTSYIFQVVAVFLVQRPRDLWSNCLWLSVGLAPRFLLQRGGQGNHYLMAGFQGLENSESRFFIEFTFCSRVW